MASQDSHEHRQKLYNDFMSALCAGKVCAIVARVRVISDHLGGGGGLPKLYVNYEGVVRKKMTNLYMGGGVVENFEFLLYVNNEWFLNGND